jgi:hypothetical protein
VGVYCVQRRRVLCAKRLLLPRQRPLVHGLCLCEPALIPVQDPKVVDFVQRRNVLCAKRLLLPRQRPLVHGLCLCEPALIPAQDPKVVETY